MPPTELAAGEPRPCWRRLADRWLVLVESNTTGTGRLFAGAARALGLRPVLLARDPARYPYVAERTITGQPCDTGTRPPCSRLLPAAGPADRSPG